MDILYVIGRGSRWLNNELRYSLRSIEKYGINVGRIYISGYCPDFIDKNTVTFIPCDDMFNRKHNNILRCIEEAVEKSDIGEEFLLSSDDHFYIKPTDFDNYPYFRKAESLPDNFDPDSNRFYRESLISTYKLLKSCELPVNEFNWHGNTHFNKRLFCEERFQHIRQLAYCLPGGCEPTCLMLNYQLSREPFEITDRNDCKLNENATEADFVRLVGDRECISCASSVNNSFIVKFLEREFPNKSKYEKNAKC